LQAVPLEPSTIYLASLGLAESRRTMGGTLTRLASLLTGQPDTTAESLGLGKRHPLFCTYSSNNFGQPISDRYVRAGLVRLAVKAGLDKRVHPHGLRHTLAVDLDNQRVPLRMIADQFGHASTATTDEYLRRLNPTQLVDVMAARRWQDDQPN
jgi:integrase